MVNLKTKFIGLELKSPIIAGSCGLTSEVSKIEEIALSGAGAIVLKSIFEEQINMDASKALTDNSYPESADYIQNYIRANTVQQHIDLVKAVKNKVNIPVIASINCLRDGEWISFASELEKAGADALELNAFILPMDEFAESVEVTSSISFLISGRVVRRKSNQRCPSKASSRARSFRISVTSFSWLIAFISFFFCS